MFIWLRRIAVAEMLAGLAFLALPVLMASLILGVAPGPGAALAIRGFGAALVVFALLCLRFDLLLAMLIYSAGAVVGLILMVGIGAPGGVLFWPILVIHAVAALVLARGYFVAPQR